ncbi:UDP-glucose dehydrogenase [Proteiniborus ethanoligenes]|uniref:UDP-glucose 6-dehydrogenase n=1 Tax=Proteiniborus ethanoligenes TaxID=415015 RepID=A0A1H3K2R8_9FIRM|nr:UDP-glucose/GDP-mannose dehydrogenase family protein [Proteiniborus ethanoligenes]SDY45898.1 UDP-glucose dehydrogenase [Proteiniborus ethanoligenes]
MNICVVGTGYVGLVTALGFAKLGNRVICVDKDDDKIGNLNKGIPSIYEEGIEEILRECLEKKRIAFTNDLSEGINNSEIIFIAVGTPEKDDWNIDMTQVHEVVNQISNIISSYKIIVIKSTVPVGTQRETKKHLREKGVPEENFDIVSNPEFLSEGRALNDFLNGDRIVIGCDSSKGKIIMRKVYEHFNSEIIYTLPETAEIIKYASNAFLATKISFINEIANLCTKVGANIETVAYAMGLDKRIAPEFLRAGIGFGGSCFPKDTKALVKIGENHGIDLKIIRSAIRVNEKQRLIPIKILLNKYGKLENKTITILGLAFKPKTDDIRNAPSLTIIEELIKNKARIKCYDPIATDKVKNMQWDILCYKNLYDAVDKSDCAIICTEWDEIYSMDLSIVKERMNYPMIIDGRNILDLEKVKESEIEYYSIGRLN